MFIRKMQENTHLNGAKLIDGFCPIIDDQCPYQLNEKGRLISNIERVKYDYHPYHYYYHPNYNYDYPNPPDTPFYPNYPYYTNYSPSPNYPSYSSRNQY